MLVVESFGFVWSIWNWFNCNFLFHDKNAIISAMQCVVVMFVSRASKRGTGWLSRVKVYLEWDGSKLLLTCKEAKCYQLWPWRLTQKHQQKLKRQLHCQIIFCSRGKYVPRFIHRSLCCDSLFNYFSKLIILW